MLIVMLADIYSADGSIMAGQKKPKSGDTQMKDRRSISVRLTDEELKALKRMALDTDSTSIDIATDAIREVLRKHQSRK
jgi:hypothetical protein